MRFLAGRAEDAGEFRSAFGGAWVSPERSERRRRLNAGCGNPSLSPASPVLHAKNNLVNSI